MCIRDRIRVWVKRSQDKAVKKLETDFEGIIKKKETEALERGNVKDRVDYKLSAEAAAQRGMYTSQSNYLLHHALEIEEKFSQVAKHVEQINASLRRFDLHDNLFQKHDSRISTNLANAVQFTDRLNALEKKLGNEKVEIHTRADTISQNLVRHQSHTKSMEAAVIKKTEKNKGQIEKLLKRV